MEKISDRWVDPAVRARGAKTQSDKTGSPDGHKALDIKNATSEPLKAARVAVAPDRQPFSPLQDSRRLRERVTADWMASILGRLYFSHQEIIF